MDELRIPNSRRPSQHRMPSRKGSLLLFDYKHPSSNNLKDDSDPSGRGLVREMSPKSPLASSSNNIMMFMNHDRFNSRLFKAIQGLEFQGVPLPDEAIAAPNTHAPFANVPVFLGPDGTFYDVNYVPVTEYTPPNGDANDPLVKLNFTPGSPVYNNFPEIDSFHNFFDYEQAVVDWRNSVLKNLGWLQLPTVLGRFYSRPKMISESRTRRDSTASSDSASYADSDDRLPSGSYVDSPPVDSKFGSMDFDFIPSPLPDTILDPLSMSSSSIVLDSDTDSDFTIHRQYGDNDSEYNQYQVRPSLSENGLNDSPNNSEREDNSKSPRVNFRKSQSFTRSGSVSHYGPGPSLGSGLGNSTSGLGNSTSGLSASVPNSSPTPGARKLTQRLSDQDLRSQMLEGYEESRWTYSRDTWESTLVPPEPIPAYYATYEEYDGAMKRWAKECINKMTFIPPHPLQLQEVIKLSPAMELMTDPRTQPVPDQPRTGGQELPSWKIRSGEISYDQLYEPIIKRTPLFKSDNFSLVQTFIPLSLSLLSTPRERSLSSSTSGLTHSPSLSHVPKSNSPTNIHNNINSNNTNNNNNNINSNNSNNNNNNNNINNNNNNNNNNNSNNNNNNNINPHVLVPSASSGSLNSPSLSRLSAPARRKLQDCFETLGRNIDQEHLVRHFDILPTFMPNWKQSVQTKLGSHVIPDLPHRAARRTDIHAELDMSPLQKEYPEPEPVFNYSKLLAPSKTSTKEREAYITQAKNTILQLDAAFRFDHMYSQFTTCSQKDINQIRAEFFSFLGQGPVTLEAVRKIVSSRMFIDKFKDLLGETVPNSYDDSTFLHMFMDILQAEPLKNFLLELIVSSNDEFVKAKVSVVVNSILSVPRGHTWVALVIENYVDHDDLEALYRFALATTFMQPKPFDVYPYRPTLHEPIIKKVFKNEGVQNIVTQVYVYYYLSVISKFASHPDISEWLDSKKKEVSHQLAESMQKDKSFLSSELFRGIAHRSSSLSNHFLFLATQLLHCYDVSMQRVLRSQDAMLISNVTNLAYSKFVHTQYAARRLTAILRDDPWRDFYLSEVDKSKAFFDDLKEVSERNPDAPTLQSTLMLNLVDCALENIPNNREQIKTFAGSFLLSDDLFHKALNFMAKAKNLDASAEAVSILMEKVSRALYAHNLAEASDKVKTTTKNKLEKTQESVQISLADIQSITTIIHKVGIDKAKIRTHMLNCLRNLLKHSRTFDLVRKETHIHLRLIGFCKDGKNMLFNKTSWKLFYQLLHYHKESLEQFEKSKILTQFLDILGTNSGNTIMLNSLRYTYKIFSLLDRETERMKAGKAPARGGDTKTLEKDLKHISRIFVQAHLFIKIHMIYKRLMGHQQGASFIQLAQLYHVIGKNPIYRKLCKDIQRNPEYKDGLFKICNMFYPPHTINPVPNLAPQS